jgi:hypothetical protein
MRLTKGGGEVHGWVTEKAQGGAHRGGRVGGGTRPRFHGDEVPLVAGSRQGVEGARGALRGAIWAEEEGVWGRKKWGMAAADVF